MGWADDKALSSYLPAIYKPPVTYGAIAKPSPKKLYLTVFNELLLKCTL